MASWGFTTQHRDKKRLHLLLACDVHTGLALPYFHLSDYIQRSCLMNHRVQLLGILTKPKLCQKVFSSYNKNAVVVLWTTYHAAVNSQKRVLWFSCDFGSARPLSVRVAPCFWGSFDAKRNFIHWQLDFPSNFSVRNIFLVLWWSVFHCYLSFFLPFFKWQTTFICTTLFNWSSWAFGATVGSSTALCRQRRLLVIKKS